MNHPTALIVGDHFIPSDFYVESLRAAVGDRVGVDTISLGGTKGQQHADQQVMEVNGPNAVAVDDLLLSRMRASQFVCVHFAPVPSVAMEDSAVEAVFTARTGVENVDVEAATRAGVPVFNVHGRNASAVAELAIGLMLAEARNIARADRSIKVGGWRKEYPLVPVEIGGATVGLVGLGAVGKELARRLRGFGVRLLVADPYVDQQAIREEGGEPVALDFLFRQSDFISLQARVTPETTEMIDQDLLRLMKPTSYLINVGRSRLVKTVDLVSALAQGSIAGAGLDVYDEEPLPPDSELRRLDNVTLTTHFGGDTLTTNRRSARLVAEAMMFYLEGDVSRAVNADALE